MRKDNRHEFQHRIERRVWWINVAYLSAIITLASILAVKFNLASGCGPCFEESLANTIFLYALAALCFSYIISIPIMINKVWRSKKVKPDNDCDEGSCSY